MNKTITLLAITSLAFASKPEDSHHPKPKGKHSLGVLDDELHTLSTVKSFRPPYYPPPFFPEDKILYDDEELFSLEKVEKGIGKALNFAKEHPEIVQKAVNRYAENHDLLKQDAKKALKYVSQNPEIIKQVVNMAKNLNHDDELVSLNQLIKDGTALTKTQTAEELAQRKAKFVRDVEEAVQNGKKFLGEGDENEADNTLSLWSHIKKEIETLENAI